MTVDSSRDDFTNYFTQAALLDGSPIYIRQVHHTDRERLQALFRRLSPESMRLRFHGARRALTEIELSRLTTVDFFQHAALVATRDAAPAVPIIAVAEYVRQLPPHHARAEVALAVLDECQGHGIGSLLLKHLAIIARAHRLQEFEADVLAGNHQMLEVLEHSGLQLKRSTSSGVVHVRLALTPGSPAM